MTEPIKQEWEILHRDHERYEQFALVIKLFAVVMALSCWVVALDTVLTITLVLILWLQEAIWKTFQARIGARLLWVEKILREPGAKENAPYQLYTTWSAQRPNIAAMVAEYFASAIRPTVAYPYTVLILLTVGAHMFSSAQSYTGSRVASCSEWPSTKTDGIVIPDLPISRLNDWSVSTRCQRFAIRLTMRNA